MGGFIDVAGMANPKLQRVETASLWQYAGPLWRGYGPYMQLPFYGSFTLREDGRYGDNGIRALVVDSANVHRKMTIEGIETRAQLLT